MHVMSHRAVPLILAALSFATASATVGAQANRYSTDLYQAGELAEQRDVGEFDGPSGPPFGPARCSAGLLAFAHWLQPRGY